MREPYKPRPAGSPHALTTELIGAMGGVARVAELLGKKPHVVQSWTDPAKSPGGIPLFYAVRLTEISGSALLAELLAAHANGWFVVADPVSGDWRDLLAQTARGSSGLIAELAALDATPAPQKARAMLSAVHEHQRVVMTVRAHLTDAARG